MNVVKKHIHVNSMNYVHLLYIVNIFAMINAIWLTVYTYAGAEGFWVAELRVRQLKIGSKSCLGNFTTFLGGIEKLP